jgi:glycosyltransferase involved in cell wall biosynthesis
VGIGIDARLWNETGVGRYIRALFKYLPHDRKFVWFLNSPTYEQLGMPKNWKKVRCNVRWHTFAEQIKMPILFYKENLDLLHVPYVNFPLFYFKKTVSTIHDLIPDHFRTGRATTLPWWFFEIKKLGYKFLVWLATVRAEKIFTLSNDAKNELISHYHVDPKKIVFTYESGGLEGGKVNTTDQMKKLKPYILYVGNAHPHKNVENLIKATRILKKRLVIVGYDEFFQKRLPKSKYVKIVGEVPNSEIVGWYKNAEAFVSASKMEGFGIPPLEAMSVGCPVILSDIPVFHEINGEAVEYFDHTDPAKIAAKVKEVLANKKRLKEMISSGYKQSARYSWKKMTYETFETYSSVIPGLTRNL